MSEIKRNRKKHEQEIFLLAWVFSEACLLEELGLHVSFCSRMTKLLNRSFTGLNVFNLLSQTQADRSLNLLDCFSQMSQRDGDAYGMESRWEKEKKLKRRCEHIQDTPVYQLETAGCHTVTVKLLWTCSLLFKWPDGIMGRLPSLKLKTVGLFLAPPLAGSFCVSLHSSFPEYQALMYKYLIFSRR